SRKSGLPRRKSPLLSDRERGSMPQIRGETAFSRRNVPRIRAICGIFLSQGASIAQFASSRRRFAALCALAALFQPFSPFPLPCFAARSRQNAANSGGFGHADGGRDAN